MGRPRKYASKWPAGVYYRHGAFYKVVKGKWHRLGETYEQMQEGVKRFEINDGGMGKDEILRLANLSFTRSRNNSKSRSHEFALARDDVIAMLIKAKWRCAITGLDFNVDVIGGKRPYLPSIDRIDNSVGYLPSNCRIVCSGINIAMNVWGLEVLRKLTRKATSYGRLMDTARKTLIADEK